MSTLASRNKTIIDNKSSNYTVTQNTNNLLVSKHLFILLLDKF